MCCFHQENNKMNKTKLKQLIKEELGDPSGEAAYEDRIGRQRHPTLPISQEAVDAVAAVMAQDEVLSHFVEKFTRYAQSGGSVVASLEAALPEWVPGKLIHQAVAQAQAALTGEETPLPSRPSPAASPEEMDKYESDYFNENKMNNLKQLVKETLEATLNEDRWLEQGAMGELEHIASELERAAEAMASAPTHDTPDRYANAIFKLAKQLRYAMDALSGRNPGGSIGEAQINEGPDALSAIENEADGLVIGADRMIVASEDGKNVDGKKIGEVLKNKAAAIKDHVKRHREEMSQPGW
jgi:hypothetical protein